MSEIVPQLELSLEKTSDMAERQSADLVLLRRSQEIATERSHATAFTLGAAAVDLAAFAFGLPEKALNWSAKFLYDIVNIPGCVSGVDDFTGKSVGVVRECINRLNTVNWDVVGPLKSPLMWASSQQTFKEYAAMAVTAGIAAGAVYLTYRAARAWLRDIPDIINRPLEDDVDAARILNE